MTWTVLYLFSFSSDCMLLLIISSIHTFCLLNSHVRAQVFALVLNKLCFTAVAAMMQLAAQNRSTNTLARTAAVIIISSLAPVRA